MKFEWDNNKAISNIKKHGVSFNEAVTIFNDPLSITFDDPDHSFGEERFLTFGLSDKGSYIILGHTDIENKTRVITARLMTKKERGIYEEY